ncbi:hypothetical protein [Mesorhizobium shangrilense]|uniref:Transporter substrate-binding domain-containing protein n=1 Tax=Mesorhizobium shangrilense TaxID=460060 RepID=A0ABV2DSM4_9HYPH
MVAAAISVVTLIWPASVPARVEDPLPVLQHIKASGVLKFPMMVAKGRGYITDPRTGYWSGNFMDWGKNIAGLLGVKIEYYETPWSNFAADFQADKINLEVGLNPNPVPLSCRRLFPWRYCGGTGDAWSPSRPGTEVLARRPA